MSRSAERLAEQGRLRAAVLSALNKDGNNKDEIHALLKQSAQLD